MSQNGINIYRMHGSMSWILKNGEIFNTRDYERRMKTKPDEHLLIYPGYKGNPHLNNNETDAYTEPSNAFDREISTSEFLIVIGFSFRDIHINEMVQKAMERNEKLYLIVFNPEWPIGENGVMDKIRVLYENRVVHIEEYFGEEKAIKILSKVLKGKLPNR